MAFQNRRARRMMAEHLEARATTPAASSTTSYQQPTTAIPLTTTFTPPSSCFDNILTMMPPPGYMIWANEPVPVENQTVANCYPSEFLESYTSVSSASVGSSVVPAMSPFVCPKNYCTMFAKEKNYIACCPSGYQFHPPDTTVDTDRPGYGGTCYSDFAVSTDYPVIAYNTTGETASQVFSASASGAQAYAHPIDGFALTSPSIIGCPTPTPSFSSASSFVSLSSSQVSSSVAASSSAAAVASSKSLSTGAIAGASVGGVIGLAALVGFVWFVLAFYRKHRRPPTPPPKAHHMGDDFSGPKDHIFYRYEAEAGYAGNEIGTSGRGVDEKGGFRNSELNDGHGAFEMDGNTPAELDAGAGGKGGTADEGKKVGDNRLSKFLDKVDKERITKMANWKDQKQ